MQPQFFVGQAVRVVAGPRNNTPRSGIIRQIIWHWKDERFNYYLEENGRKISKRYFAEDLERAESIA